MSKSKTIKFEFDNREVFKLKISGSDEIVDYMAKDMLLLSKLREAAEKLINNNVDEVIRREQN